MSRIANIDIENPDRKVIKQAVSVIRDGLITAYPTETFYGLGVDVTNDQAIKHLFDLKRRDYGNPIAIIVADRAMLESVVTHVPSQAEALIENYWPGPLTILFSANDCIARGLMTNTGKIGIRISSNPVATALSKALGRPLTTTSANLAGYPPSFDVSHIKKYFRDKIDLILDGGELLPSRGSTVVDVSEEKMVIIREGDIAAENIFQLFEEDHIYE
jgi:L-threonylcarbamoyladenylate synthase